MKRRVLKPWHGLVFFILIMTAFFLICVPMQMHWGMYGLAATEILILVMSLVFAKLMGYPLKVLFPVSRPRLLPLLGTFVIWLSTYIFTMSLMLIQFRLFPEPMTEVSSGLNEVIFSVPFLLSALFTAVMPAICEEAVHRGVIIHTLYSIRKEWVVVLIMGIYFGLFHSDPLRFLPTALLGAAMSYVMLEKENMVYPAFFHFINNFLPLVLQLILLGGMNGSRQMEQAEEILASGAIETIPIASIAIYVIFASVTPFGLYLGNYLIHHQKGVQKIYTGRKTVEGYFGDYNSYGGYFLPGSVFVRLWDFFDPVMKDILRESMKIAENFR